MKKTILSALVVLSLVGCGDKQFASFGVGVDNSKSNSNETSVSGAQTSTTDISKKSSKTVKLNGLMLLGDSVKILREQIGDVKKPRASILSSKDVTQLSSLTVAKGPGSSVIGAMTVIDSGFEPALGWPSAQAPYDKVLISKLVASCKFTNMIACEAIQTVDDNAIQDPSTAHEALLRSVVKIGDEKLQQLWEMKLDEAKKLDPKSNTAGSSAAIEIIAGGELIFIGEKGCNLMSSGTHIFGAGHVCGKVIELSMESSIASSTGDKLSTDFKKALTNSSSVKTDAGIKN